VRGGRLRENILPNIKLSSIHTILALVMHMDLELAQMDTKTYFLHGELDEVIFMDQPEVFLYPKVADSSSLIMD